MTYSDIMKIILPILVTTMIGGVIAIVRMWNTQSIMKSEMDDIRDKIKELDQASKVHLANDNGLSNQLSTIREQVASSSAKLDMLLKYMEHGINTERK